MKPINLRTAAELGVGEHQVAGAVSLLDSGATVPFVARYPQKPRQALAHDPDRRDSSVRKILVGADLVIGLSSLILLVSQFNTVRFFGGNRTVVD
jgi:Tex-like protein N-terminal domain